MQQPHKKRRTGTEIWGTQRHELCDDLYAPWGVEFGPRRMSNRKLWVCCNKKDALHVYDMDNNMELPSVISDSKTKNWCHGPRAICFQPGSNNMILTSNTGVHVLAPDSGQTRLEHLYSINHDIFPMGVTCSPGGCFFVCDPVKDSVLLFDEKGHKVTAYSGTKTPFGICFADQGTLCVTTYFNSSVSKFGLSDSQTLTKLSTIDTSPMTAQGVCYSQKTREMVVAFGYGTTHSVCIYDKSLSSSSPLRQVQADFGECDPTGVCCDPETGMLVVSEFKKNRVRIFC